MKEELNNRKPKKSKERILLSLVIVFVVIGLVVFIYSTKNKEKDNYATYKNPLIDEQYSRYSEAEEILKILGKETLLNIDDVRSIIYTFYQVKLWEQEGFYMEVSDYTQYDYKKIDKEYPLTLGDTVKIVGEQRYLRENINEEKTEEALKIVKHLQDKYGNK